MPDLKECEGLETYSHLQELVANIPYLLMTGLGSAVLVAGLGPSACGWTAAGLYAVYGLAGAVWIMIFMCPFCAFHGTRNCPCGYGWIAAKLRAKKNPGNFGKKFMTHIPVIVPLWFIPPIAGAIVLWRGFSWPLFALVVVFAVNSFLVLPLVSSRHCCARCPQKEDCPWMKRRGSTPAPADGESGG